MFMQLLLMQVNNLVHMRPSCRVAWQVLMACNIKRFPVNGCTSER